MEPKSNTEFVSQLANFTALKANQDALYFQNANYAQSLVGKTVTIASMQGSRFAVESGIVTSMSLADGTFMVKVNGKNYPLSNIMEVTPSSNPYHITGSDGAYATALIGKQVTVTGQDGGKNIIENGIVQRVEIINNEINVILNINGTDLAYPLGSVIKVETGGGSLGSSGLTTTDWAYATSLIGKHVTVTEPDDEETNSRGNVESGIVSQVQVLDGKIKIMIDGASYPLSYVTKVADK
jgi:flagellar basal-body rod modification protein FlgD